MRLARLVSNQSPAVLVMVALVCAAGLYAAWQLPIAIFPVTGYSLTSDARDLASLRDVATYTIRPQLARLSGVATVGVAGGKVREFHVMIDSDRLVAHNVSVQQVVDAVHNSNIIVSPGLIEENHQLELGLV